MRTEELVQANIWLSFKTAKALIHQCEREYLLPRHIPARSLGESMGEAVIFKLPDQERWILPDYRDFSALNDRESEGRGVKHQQRIYLAILSQIAKAMPEKFAEVAPTLNGTKRAYFGRTRQEVEATGRKNKAERVPDTEWWAGVDNDRFHKEKILARLMREIGGFSEDYIDIISRAAYRKFPELSGLHFKSV